MFTDETWASTNMARRHGRCARGERLRIGVPHGHRKTTTFLGALMLPGFIAAFVLDGPINRDAFETYVEQVLVRELSPGSLVIMDNLLSHKGPGVRELIEAAGARLLHRPSYGPDFNLIEKPSRSSRHCCAKQQSGLLKGCGHSSANSSLPVNQPNAETASPPPDMMQTDRISL